MLLSYGCASGSSGWLLRGGHDKAAQLADGNAYKTALALADKNIARAKNEQAKNEWITTRNDLQARAENFKLQQSDEISGLVGSGDWLNAEAKIDLLEKNLPADGSLTAQIEAWRAEQRAQQDMLLSNWQLLRSHQLPETIALLEKRYRAAPDSRLLRKKIAALKQESEQIYAALFVRFNEAEAAGKNDTALLYARALQRLKNSEQVALAIQRLRVVELPVWEGIAAPANVPPDKRAERAYQSLLNAYGKALVNEQWLEARAALDKLLILRPQEPELLGQDTHLKEIFKQQISAARQEGEKLYSAGKVEDALSAWASAQKLAPNDPQLRANIERAQRILDKVKSLTSESAVEN